MDGNKKLIGDLRVGLNNLQQDVNNANKILKGIDIGGLNLDIMDSKTKAKLVDGAKAIKTQLESIGKTGIDLTLINGMLKAFNSIEIKSKEMKAVVSETYATIGSEALKMSTVADKANNITATSYAKTGQKIKEIQQGLKNDEGKIVSYGNPMSTITTDDASAKLTQIATAYQRLNMEGKTTTQSLLGMANEVQKATDKYGLLGTSLKSANTQQMSYRNEADRLVQTEARQATSIATEAQKRVEAANKIAAANEKQSLSTLAMYTQETAALSKYDKMSKTLQEISGEAGLAMSSSNAGSSIGDRFKISGVYALAAQSIYMLRQGVTELIQTNRDFEAGIVDLSRVLGNLTESEKIAFGEKAISLAKTYGIALKEVQSSYSALAAAGVEKSDINSMANTVMLGLNTSSIKSGAEMTDLLTTSMKQLGIEMSQSEKVLDGWNYLADKSVATTADYANAISKAGATSKAVGVDINELNGIVSVLSNATGMSGSASGDAIKSVETRLLRPDALKTLKEYGIEVMKNEHEFKSFGDIIKETSDVLNKFGDNTIESNNILDALGGTMRKNTVNILSQGYSSGEVDSYKQQSAVDSVGYSAKKSAAEMDTLEKKIQVFSATIKELYIGVGNNGLMTQLKGIVDLGTAFASTGAKIAPFLITIVEVSASVKILSGSLKMITGSNLTQWLDKSNLSFNVFGKSMSFGGTATNAYNAAAKSLQAQMISGNITATESATILQTLGTKLGLASSSTNILMAAEMALDEEVAKQSITREAANAELLRTRTLLNANIVSTEGAIISQEALDASQKAVAASALAMNVAMGVGILALTLGITYIASHWNDAAKAQEEYIKKTEEQIASLKTQQSDMSDLIATYDKLASTTSKSTDEQKQYLDIQNKISDISPDLVDHYDSEGNAILKSTEALKEYTNQLKLQATEKENALQDNYAKQIQKETDSINKNKEAIADSIAAQKKTEEYNKAHTNTYIDIAPYNKDIETVAKKSNLAIKESNDNIDSFLVKIRAGISGYTTLTGVSKNLADVLNKGVKFESLEQYDKAIKNIAISISSNNIEGQLKDYQKLNDEYKNGNVTLDVLNTAYSKLFSTLSSLKLSDGDIKKFLVNIDSTDVTNMSILAESVLKYADAQSKLETSFHKSETAIKDLDNAITKMQHGQKLNAEEISDLIIKYPELSGAVEGNTGAYTINEKALNSLRIANINEAKTTLNTQLDDTKHVLDGVKDRLRGYGIEITAITNLAAARELATKVGSNEQSSSAYSFYSPAQSAETTAQQKALKDSIIQYGTLKDEIKALSSTLGDPTIGVTKEAPNVSGGSNSAEKQENSALILKDRYYQLNQELLKTQNLLDTNNALQSDADANNNIKEKISLEQQQIALIKKKQVETRNLEIEQSKERSETVSTLSSSGLTFSGHDDLATPLNANIILQQKLDAMNDHRNDKDKTYYNQLKTEYDDYNTVLQRFFTLQNTEIPKSKSEWQSLASEISKVKVEIDKASITNLTTEYDTAITSIEGKLKDLELAQKLLASTDTSGQANISSQKQALYNSEITATLNYMDKLAKTTVNTAQGQQELNKAYDNAKNKLIGYETSLIDINKTIQDNYLSAVKDTESKVIDLLKEKYKEMQDLEETRHTTAIDNLNKEKDAFDSAIDDKIAKLDEQQNSTDYTTGLNKLLTDKSKLQLAHDELLMDSSQESVAKRTDLEQQLSDKQTEINNYQNKHNLDLQKKSLTNQKKTYDDSIKDATDAETKAYEAHKKALSENLENDKLYAEANSAIMSGVYTDANGQIQNLQTSLLLFQDKFGEGLSLLGQSIKRNLIDNLTIAMNVAKNGMPTSTNTQNGTTSFPTPTPMPASNMKTVFGNDVDLANAESILGTQSGYDFENINSTSKALSQGDLVVGGSAVTGKFTDSLISSAGAIRLSGTDRESTAQKIKDYLSSVKGYANGGLIQEDQLAVLHGKNANSNFEAVLNEPQLKKLVSEVSLNTLKVQAPKFDMPTLSFSSMAIPNLGLGSDSGGQPISFHFDNLINIEGNVDKDTLPSVQALSNQVFGEIQKELNKAGFFRR